MYFVYTISKIYNIKFIRFYIIALFLVTVLVQEKRAVVLSESLFFKVLINSSPIVLQKFTLTTGN